MTDEGTTAFHADVDGVWVPLERLLDATATLRLQWGQQPAADSVAMAELSTESPLAADPPWGREPVADSHQTAWLLVIVAEDHIRALGRLVTADPVTTWAHMVVGRAALEALGRATWLAAVDLGGRRRVARMMNDRIYSLGEIAKMPIDNRSEIEQRRKSLIAMAEDLGYKKLHTPQGPCFEDRRMGNTAIVRWLLDEHETPDSVGEVLYRYFSAVAHATLDGVAQSVSVVDRGDGLARRSAAVFTNSADVRNLFAAIVIGYTAACDSLIHLFGWERTESYHAAWVSALEGARVHPVN